MTKLLGIALVVMCSLLLVLTGLLTFVRSNDLPDSWIVYETYSQTEHRLYRMAPDGSRLEAVTDIAFGYTTDPIGNSLGGWLFAMKYNGQDWELVRMYPDGSQPMVLFQLPSQGRLIEYAVSPNGRQIIYRGNQSIFVWDIHSQHVVDLGIRQGFYDFAWSPTQDLIVHSSPASRLGMMRSDGAIKLVNDQQPRYFESSPTWSPDGEWIAFAAMRGDNDLNGIYRVRADGTEEQFLMQDAFPQNMRLAWSPDGESIAFTSNSARNGRIGGIYRMTLATGEIERISGNQLRFGELTWIPAINTALNLKSMLGLFILLAPPSFAMLRGIFRQGTLKYQALG